MCLLCEESDHLWMFQRFPKDRLYVLADVTVPLWDSPGCISHAQYVEAVYTRERQWKHCTSDRSSKCKSSFARNHGKRYQRHGHGWFERDLSNSFGKYLPFRTIVLLCFLIYIATSRVCVLKTVCEFCRPTIITTCHVRVCRIPLQGRLYTKGHLWNSTQVTKK